MARNTKGPLVTDFPVWSDHPWRDIVPAHIEVRRSTPSEAVFVQHSTGRVDRHTVVDLDAGVDAVKAALRNLGVSI